MKQLSGLAALAIPAALAILAAPLGGCAAALKDAPPLAELADAAGPGESPGTGGLMARAAELERRRDLEDMRRAAALYLQSAAGGASGWEALVAAARTEVWLTDHETDPALRQEAATRSVQASQWCTRVAPEQPDCVYWLGASLGVQARERPSTGLSALPRIEASFKDAASRAPQLDDGGPDRALALLYLRAPGWPAGPGDAELALQHARRAVELSPLHPPNLLALAEALTAAGDGEGSLAAARQALDLARAAAGREPDAPDWIREAERALNGETRLRP